MLKSLTKRIIHRGILCLLSGTSMFSVALFSSDESANATVKLTPAREQFKKWYESASMPLRDGQGKFVDLRLEERIDGKENVSLSTNQNQALHDIINWTLEAFCSKDFDEYHGLIEKIAKGKVSLSDNGRNIMGYFLVAGESMKQPEVNSLTDYELAEAFWMIRSQNGYPSKHFVGLISSETFYMLKKIRNPGDVMASGRPHPFPDSRIFNGMLQPTFFLWGSSDPAKSDPVKKNEAIVVADIRYLIKTDTKDVAYPICVRVWWSKDLGLWIPWLYCNYSHYIEHYLLL